jgi:hypothetical protein
MSALASMPSLEKIWLTWYSTVLTVMYKSRCFWVLVCFFGTQDGQEHTVLGMVKVIQIVK